VYWTNLILDILSDGKLHGIEELKAKINVNDFELKEILLFMSKFDFVEIVDEKKVKSKKNFKRLIALRTN
jgi:hypothetical protein